MSNGNMDLLAQAITQRPPQSPKSDVHNAAPYNPRKMEKGGTSPPLAANSGESRVNARRNNMLASIQNLENEFAKKKDRYFHEQLLQLQEDLSRLHNSTHSGFLNGVSDLIDIRNESLYIAREEGLSKLHSAEEDYEREIAAARTEYETTRTTLKNDLLTYLNNKRKRLDLDSSLTDISLAGTLSSAAAAAIEAPPSPSLGSHGVGATTTTAGSRKLRHRVPVQATLAASYPSTALTSKSALDEVLETLGETIRARHFKPTQQPLNEDRIRDRIEREREKLVKTMLVGANTAEIDADLAEMKRKYPGKKGNSSTSTGGTAGGVGGVGSGGGGNGGMASTSITHSGSKKVKV